MPHKTAWIKEHIWKRVEAYQRLQGGSLGATINDLLNKGLGSEILLTKEAQEIVDTLSKKPNTSRSLVVSELIITGYKKAIVSEYYEKSIRHKNKRLQQLELELSQHK